MLTYLILLFGVFIISWSSILIRWIGPLHPLIIAFYRLLISVLVLIPLIFANKKKIKFTFGKYHLLFLSSSGFLLALHFFSWIQSLQWTTVGNSIFLESTHPVFAFILSYFILKEKGSRWVVVGILLALGGIFLIVKSDVNSPQLASLGDWLALFSALCLAAYLLIARFYRYKMALLPYLIQVYGAAAIFTFIFILMLKLDFFHIPLQSWFFLFLLALGPNLIGHSLLNWASRKMPVYLVNLSMQGEAVLATLLAALFLQEKPPPLFYLGAFLILMAVSFIFFVKR